MKKLAKVKKYKSQAKMNREKAGVSQQKAAAADKKRKAARNKYSTVAKILFLLFILPSLLFGQYIVWDEEDQVNRDYGNITNYVKSLEEEKIIFLATQGYLKQTIVYYSNAYSEMSNASTLQEEVIEEQKPSWCSRMWNRTKFWVGAFIGSGVVLIFLL
jgi:hypothetical protein